MAEKSTAQNRGAHWLCSMIWKPNQIAEKYLNTVEIIHANK